jgi:hypothetical protein
LATRFDENGSEVREGLLPFHGVHLANAVLLVGLSWWSWRVFPDLPAEIPGHIGPGGIRWEPTTVRSWFSIPFLAAGLTALHYGLIPFIRRTNRFNIPSSASFDDLLPGDQEEVRTLTIRFLQWMNVLLLAGLWFLQGGSYETAMNPEGGIGLTSAMGIAYLVVVPSVVSWGFLIYLIRAVRDGEERARTHTAG